MKRVFRTLHRLATSSSAASPAEADDTPRRKRCAAWPASLGLAMFGAGWLIGAGRPIGIESPATALETAARDEVDDGSKAPSLFARIARMPGRLFQSPANAKCYYCAALLNVDRVPEEEHLRERLFLCGGCGCQLAAPLATHQFLFKRRDELERVMGFIPQGSPLPVVMPLGRDEILKPAPFDEDYALKLARWKDHSRRFIERD
jgi:hypothetical protein